MTPPIHAIDEETGAASRSTIGVVAQEWRAGRFVRIDIARPDHDIEGRHSHVYLTEEGGRAFAEALRALLPVPATPIAVGPEAVVPSPEEMAWARCIMCRHLHSGPCCVAVRGGSLGEVCGCPERVDNEQERSVAEAFAAAERARAATREQELAAEVERLRAELQADAARTVELMRMANGRLREEREAGAADMRNRVASAIACTGQKGADNLAAVILTMPLFP